MFISAKEVSVKCCIKKRNLYSSDQSDISSDRPDISSDPNIADRDTRQTHLDIHKYVTKLEPRRSLLPPPWRGSGQRFAGQTSGRPGTRPHACVSSDRGKRLCRAESRYWLTTL